MSAPVLNSAEKLTGVGLVLLGSIAYSLKAIFVKLAYYEDITPIELLALRMLFAAPFYLIIVRWKGRSLKDAAARDQIALIVFGLLGYYLASILDFEGLRYISASLERILLYIYPAIVVLASAVFFKKKITARQTGGMAVAYAGVVLVCAKDLAAGGGNSAWGIALVLGCAFSYSAYLIGSEHLIKKFGVATHTSYALLAAACGVLLHYALVVDPARLVPSGRASLIALAMAIISTVLPSYLLSGGISRIGASLTAIVSTCGPLSTIILANLLLGESLTVGQAAGAALIVWGVVRVSS